MSAELTYRTHPWRGGHEWVTVLGEGRPVLLLGPLLEEMNRCRAVLVGAARAIGTGYAVHIPDLPGTGESSRELATVEWAQWREYVIDFTAALLPVAVVSARGGSLLEPENIPAWRLAPVDGTKLLRELLRGRKAAGDDRPTDRIDAEARETGIDLAGYPLGPALYAGLSDARVPDRAARTVRLRGDASICDVQIDAAPLWRTAEPRRDPALSHALGHDIRTWLDTCAG